MINYDLIPEHCRDSMKRYIEHGVIPGGFLQAVICNDLVGAFGKADQTNRHRLYDYCDFLYNYMPDPAWGSKEKMIAWSKKKTEKQ